MARPLTSREVQVTRAVAAGADLLQFAIFPLMFQGWLSPLNVAVDVAMAVFFTWRLGFHWALLPTFISELIPFWDLAPTWTVAVFLATRGREVAGSPDDVIDVTAVRVEDPEGLPPAKSGIHDPGSTKPL
jgi:hypothetical protein